MPQTYIRPEILYAWHGQTLLIVNTRGDCGEDQTFSGFYFRDARHLRILRLTIDGELPCCSEAAVIEPSMLHFDYVHPEMHSFGGGGSGQSGDEMITNDRRTSHRALDELRISLEVTNRSQRKVTFDVGWALDAVFADIQEAQGVKRQQEARVTRDGDGCLVRFRYEHPDLPHETYIPVTGDGDWSVTPDGVAAHLTLGTQDTATLALLIDPRDLAEPMSEDDVAERERAWAA